MATKSGAVKVRQHKNKKTGVKLWLLDFGWVRQPDGTKKRTRTYHATQDLAIAAMNEAKNKREWHGDSAISISHEDVIRFTRAQTTLAALGATIEQAVALLIRNARVLRQPVAIHKLLAD